MSGPLRHIGPILSGFTVFGSQICSQMSRLAGRSAARRFWTSGFLRPHTARSGQTPRPAKIGRKWSCRRCRWRSSCRHGCRQHCRQIEGCGASPPARHKRRQVEVEKSLAGARPKGVIIEHSPVRSTRIEEADLRTTGQGQRRCCRACLARPCTSSSCSPIGVLTAAYPARAKRARLSVQIPPNLHPKQQVNRLQLHQNPKREPSQVTCHGSLGSRAQNVLPA